MNFLSSLKSTIQFFALSLVFILFSEITHAQHTFSIVAVDPATGEIGSAGATCIGAEDGALAVSDIILGVGAINTQAFWVPANQNNARTRMLAGDSPQQIINWLVANDISSNPAERQYGIVDLNGGNPRSAAYTGSNNFSFALHVTGSNYAIQGNILISEDVIYDMETAFLNTSGTLADKLMAALQGAKRVGADSRCQSFGISSASAYLRVADPSDTDSSYGNLSLDLNVWIPAGDPVFEPIDALQTQYNATLSNDEDVFSANVFTYPNPATDELKIQSDQTLIYSYKLMDVTGKLISEKNFRKEPKDYFEINTTRFDSGIYFLSLYDKNNRSTTKKIIIN